MADETKGKAGADGEREALADTPAQVRVARLRAALRRERVRGRAGHWTYDLARHLALSRQLRDAEKAAGLTRPS